MALLRVLALLAVAYLALVLVLYLGQSRLVFIPFGELRGSPADIGLTYEDVHLQSEDGIALHGWYVTHPQPRGVLLFFHGNAGNISHRLDSLAIFHRLGLEVLIIDYRGYGRSAGRPGEQGSYRDARAALHWLLEERQVDPQRLVYFGRSLGAAVAAQLASEHPPQALIMESAFSSLPTLGAELYPWLPVRLLARMEFDSQRHVAVQRAPLLLVHSREDEIIPFHHAEALQQAAGEAELLVIRGSHNRGFLLSGAEYVAGLGAFLDQHLPWPVDSEVDYLRHRPSSSESRTEISSIEVMGK